MAQLVEQLHPKVRGLNHISDIIKHFIYQHSTVVSILGSVPTCLGFDSKHSPKKFSGKFVTLANGYIRCNLEESGQWLENVDRTHLVLASGKLVLQKKDYNGLGKIQNYHCSSFNSKSWESLWEKELGEELNAVIFLLRMEQVGCRA